MTRLSGTKLAEEVLGLIAGKKGTKARTDRPQHIPGVFTIIDDVEGSLLLKSPQLKNQFGAFLQQAPVIEYNHNGHYIKKLIIRHSDGHDYIYTFPKPPRKHKPKTKESKESIPQTKVRSITERLTHPTPEEKQPIVKELLKKQLLYTPETHLPLDDIALKRKYEAKYAKAAEDYEARIRNPTEWTKIFNEAQYGRPPAQKFKPTPSYTNDIFDDIPEPEPTPTRSRSGLPALPTQRTGWTVNYSKQAGPDEYVPKGRPRDNGTWAPYKAPYQTYSYEQTYTPEGQAYTHALGAEESKSDSDEE